MLPDDLQKAVAFLRPFRVLHQGDLLTRSSTSKTVHSPSWTVSKMAEKCQSVRCHIETTVIPSDSVHSVHFPKVGSARLQILNASNACQTPRSSWPAESKRLGLSHHWQAENFRMSMSQSSKMDRDDDGTANCPGAWTTWLWIHKIDNKGCSSSTTITLTWRQAQEKGTFWQMPVFGCFCLWRTGFLKNRVHLQELGQNVEVTSFTENMIPNSF